MEDLGRAAPLDRPKRAATIEGEILKYFLLWLPAIVERARCGPLLPCTWLQVPGRARVEYVLSQTASKRVRRSTVPSWATM
jgi:hypothetical protein